MRAIWLLFGCVLFSGAARAQVGGSAGAYGNRVAPAQSEAAKRQLTQAEQKDDGASTFIQASILMNVRADSYVVVFGVSQEGATPEEVSARMETTLAEFKTALQTLGVKNEDVFVDFVSQNRVYAFQVDEERKLAREIVTGFELKKNLSVRFNQISLLDDLVSAAAKNNIFDLIKVDYLVNDVAKIQADLQRQTVDLLKRKAEFYRRELGVALPEAAQVVADQPSVYFPVDQYDSYVAAEGENISTSYAENGRLNIQRARKSRTTFFNPLSGDGFDLVVNPVIIEPVVQFTTYLKVKYPAPKARKK